MEYFQPETLDQTLDLLAVKQDARLWAGGQTLTAMLNADVLQPATLISLKAVPGLREIRDTTDVVLIGAMATHGQVAASSLHTGQIEVVRLGAVPPVRKRDTISGSVSHVAPGADSPTALTAADAQIELASKKGYRKVAATEFLPAFHTTALEEDEMVVTVHLARSDTSACSTYRKVLRGTDDFSTVSITLSGKFTDGRWDSHRSGRMRTNPCAQ